MASNTPGYVADVGLRDGRIEAIGDLSAALATQVIDATRPGVGAGVYRCTHPR